MKCDDTSTKIRAHEVTLVSDVPQTSALEPFVIRTRLCANTRYSLQHHPIRIGVMSRLASPTVSKELAREAALRGHEYHRITFDTADITSLERAFASSNLLSYDVLYYRTSLCVSWQQALERFLAKHGRRAVNLDAITHPFLEQKIYQTQATAAAGIQTPKTLIGESPDFHTIAQSLGAPFVMKASDSARGMDVHKITTEEKLEAVRHKGAGKEYFYQEYVPHKHDCRVHLVGGKAVAGYRRVPVPGDFRCNVSRGAAMESLCAEEKESMFPLAERISTLFGLNMHAVDFLTSTTNNECYFVEINNNPGWETSDKDATGVDMSKLAIDYFEKLAAQRKHMNAISVHAIEQAVAAPVHHQH